MFLFITLQDAVTKDKFSCIHPALHTQMINDRCRLVEKLVLGRNLTDGGWCRYENRCGRKDGAEGIPSWCWRSHVLLCGPASCLCRACITFCSLLPPGSFLLPSPMYAILKCWGFVNLELLVYRFVLWKIHMLVPTSQLLDDIVIQDVVVGKALKSQHSKLMNSVEAAWDLVQYSLCIGQYCQGKVCRLLLRLTYWDTGLWPCRLLLDNDMASDLHK